MHTARHSTAGHTSLHSRYDLREEENTIVNVLLLQHKVSTTDVVQHGAGQVATAAADSADRVGTAKGTVQCSTIG